MNGFAATGAVLFESSSQINGPAGLAPFTFDVGGLQLIAGKKYVAFADIGPIRTEGTWFGTGITSGINSYPNGDFVAATFGQDLTSDTWYISPSGADPITSIESDTAFIATFSSLAPLSDPMAEDYAVHLIPYYKVDEGWYAFLVIADTSWRDLRESDGGTPIDMRFYNAACNLVSDASVALTTADAQFFALHDPNAANGQFNGIPGEGVVLLDGGGFRFLTYILLVNTNDNSLIRIDSIPCEGALATVSGVNVRQPCSRGTPAGTWLRYDTYNTVAATFGDSGTFRTNLYFFGAPTPPNDDDENDLRDELRRYGRSRHGNFAEGVHANAWCNEIYLGSRRLDLKCTQRVALSRFNYTRLNEWPNDNCAGRPGHIEFFASDNGTAVTDEDFSGFQETIATLVPGINMIGTGYMHHSESSSNLASPLAKNPPWTD